MSQSRQLLDMFLATLVSPVMNSADRQDLFKLLVEQHNNETDTIRKAAAAYSEEYYAEFSDVSTEYLLKVDSGSVGSLLRQLDDPAVTDEQLCASTIAILERCMNPTFRHLLCQIINHFRPEVIHLVAEAAVDKALTSLDAMLSAITDLL